MIKQNIIILAAGKGTRLKEYTYCTPKGMVELKGKPMLHWHLQNIRDAVNAETIIVCGYEKEKLEVLNKPLVDNPDFNSTNMTASLWCAKEYFGEGFIMAYSDIVYNPDVLEKLVKSDEDISVVVDKSWLPYWKKRVDDVLDDAESLAIDENGKIKSIGQKADDIDDIEGQYIGLVYFNNKGVKSLIDIIEKEIEENRNGNSFICKGKTFGDLYITDVLQALINTDVELSPIWIDGGWIEIDTVSDLTLAEKIVKKDKDSDTIRIIR